MPSAAKCPFCEKYLPVEQSMIGEVLRCPYCGKQLAVTSRSSAAPQQLSQSIGNPSDSKPLRQLSLEVAQSAQAVGKMTKTKAQDFWIRGWSLPNAFGALGKDIYGARRFECEFSELFKALDDLSSQLSARRQAKESVAAKQMNLQRMGESIKHDYAIGVLSSRIKKRLRILGQSGFEKFGDNAGPTELVNVIKSNIEKSNEARRRFANFKTDVAKPLRGKNGNVKRVVAVAIVALIGVILITTGFFGNPPRPSALGTPPIVPSVESPSSFNSHAQIVSAAPKKLLSLADGNIKAEDLIAQLTHVSWKTAKGGVRSQGTPFEALGYAKSAMIGAKYELKLSVGFVEQSISHSNSDKFSFMVLIWRRASDDLVQFVDVEMESTSDQEKLTATFRGMNELIQYKLLPGSPVKEFEKKAASELTLLGNGTAETFGKAIYTVRLKGFQKLCSIIVENDDQ